MQKASFQLMAQYNQWMNQRLYSCAAPLSADQLAEDRGAFFRSILGTLNHIMVGDLLWLKRFASHPSGFKSLQPLLTRSNPESLGSILYDTIDELRPEREKLDTQILSFSKELSDKDLESELEYKNTKGELFTNNFSFLIQHFFNHQTHHRGQLSTLFNQLNIDIGETDLLVMIREANS
jgi:uncharacterized damage-inducible protein DinB